MNIVLAMAGRGSRFIDAGYEVPKPMIDVNGLPMFEKVMAGLGVSDAKMTIICQKSLLESFYSEINGILPKYYSKVNVIWVDKVTDGAACTVLLAKDIIDTEEDLLITDCDHMIADPTHIARGIRFFNKKRADGGIWVHLADNPKWSYCRVVDGAVKEVVEKTVISDLANTGDYYFAQGKHFVHAAERMISKNDRTNGEFYVAPVYNYLIADGMNIAPFVINEMIPLGTPKDLQLYLNKDN